MEKYVETYVRATHRDVCDGMNFRRKCDWAGAKRGNGHAILILHQDLYCAKFCACYPSPCLQ